MQSVINTSIKISPNLRERIHNLAKIRNISAHSIMLQALETFVTDEEKREAWRQEGIKAWEEFQQTGLHLTNNEVIEWMDKIIEGKKEPLPKCHL